MTDLSFDMLDRLLGGRAKRELPCPLCSHLRKPAHRKSLCFGLMRRSDDEIVFHCMNCGQNGKRSANWQEAGTRKRDRVPPTQPRRAESVGERSTDDLAAALWSRAVPAAGTLADVYWAHRNLVPPVPPSIRFLADHQGHPTLICAAGFSTLDGDDWRIPEVSGVQRIFLKPDGLGKSQPPKSLGSMKGKPVCVHVNPESLALVIGEGVEKVHALAQAMNVDGWSCSGKSFLPHLADAIPDIIECVSIIRDLDGTADREVDELAARIVSRGIEARIV